MEPDYYAGSKSAIYAKIVTNCIHSIVLKKSLIFLSGLLLLTAANSMAMSLGRHSGATLIGRPLDITVQAVLDAQDDTGNQCLEADVFYADNRLDRSRVRVTLEKSTSAPTQALIRIRSAVLVDEPVVTFYLRAGCQQKTERRYVTLAELVSEAVPDRSSSAPMPSATLAKPVVPSVNSSNATANAATPKADNADSGARPVKRNRSRASAAVTQASPGNASAVEVAPDPLVIDQNQAPKAKKDRTSITPGDNRTAPTKARLKLEPLDLLIERDPQLRASAELRSVPAANPQERAAASALWRALSAQPQDILRDTEKLQALENSVRSLQAQSQKTLLSIDDLNVKVQQAQAERYSNALVYSLGILLLAAVAALAYLQRHRFVRQRAESGDKPWWRKNDAQGIHENAWIDSMSQVDSSGLSNLNDGESYTPARRSAFLGVDVDFDLDLVGQKPAGNRSVSSLGAERATPTALREQSDFSMSMTHPVRAAKAEELFDVQQQADFFVSIGQYEQAIEVLRSHIGENKETSALVYLDLFNLYHKLKLPTEYEALRLNFNQRFNAQIPAFNLYTDKDSGLEAYQLALSRIEALWPSPKVLEIIEESLFRQPDTKAEAFNLEAYRELLLFYSVAKEIINPEAKIAGSGKKFDLPDALDDSADSRPMKFMSTSIQPLSASMDADEAHEQNGLPEAFMASNMPPSSSKLELDLDLSDFSSQAPKTVFTNESSAHFFADFDAEAAATLPVIHHVQLQPAKAATGADNLIDFDAVDSSHVAPIKPKPPKT